MPELSPIEQLRKHCEDYKAHLEADLVLLARRYLSKEDLEENYQTEEGAVDIKELMTMDLGDNDNPILINTIKKLQIVNQMLEKLNDKSAADDKKRVENMANILNDTNEAILKAHRPVKPGSSFLQIIFDIILKTFNRDLRPKTTGQRLAEEIQKLREPPIKADKTAHSASAGPDNADAAADDEEKGENLFYRSASPPGNLADETDVVLELWGGGGF